MASPQVQSPADQVTERGGCRKDIKLDTQAVGLSRSEHQLVSEPFVSFFDVDRSSAVLICAA